GPAHRVVQAGDLAARPRDCCLRHRLRASARVASHPSRLAVAPSGARTRGPGRADGCRRASVPLDARTAVVARARACDALGCALVGDGRLRRAPVAPGSNRANYDALMEDSELRLERRPVLTRAVLVASFRGWNDGGQGASMASSFLSRTWHAEQFAS